MYFENRSRQNCAIPSSDYFANAVTGIKITKPDLSFVIPAYNEEKTILKTIEVIARQANDLEVSFEIIVIDDGSRDGTFSKSLAAGKHYPVRAVRLSRNFGKENAMTAGLELSKGSAVVIMDADLQEPVSYLEDMLEEYHNGYDMVYAVRKSRQDENALKRFLTGHFYKLLKIGSDIPIPADARDFRLMDRKVVDTILSLPERNRFMKGLFSWVGFKSKPIYIDMEKRSQGVSSFGFKALVKLALTALTSFTNWPLRIWAGIGFLFALSAMIYGSGILLKTLVWGMEVPGFATITTALFFLGGIQLISIGIIGEYLSRVFTEVKGRPTYVIAEDVSPRHG